MGYIPIVYSDEFHGDLEKIFSTKEVSPDILKIAPTLNIFQATKDKKYNLTDIKLRSDNLISLTFLEDGKHDSWKQNRHFRFSDTEKPYILEYVIKKCEDYTINSNEASFQEIEHKPRGKTPIKNIKLIEQNPKPVATFLPDKEPPQIIETNEPIKAGAGIPTTNLEEAVTPEPATKNVPQKIRKKSKREIAKENKESVEAAKQNLVADLKNLKGQHLVLDGVSNSTLYGAKQCQISLLSDNKSITIGPYDFGKVDDDQIKSCLIQTLVAYDVAEVINKLRSSPSGNRNRHIF